MASNAIAADFQSCTAIKLAKDRLSCFDRFAIKQLAESDAEAEAARKEAEATRKEAETKAQEAAVIAAEKASILTAVDRFKAVVTEQFKDPASAQFRNVVAYGNAKPFHISFLCGQVNAKNSYGAYIGFRRFFTIGTVSVEVEDPKNTYVMDRMWPTTCTGNEIYRQE